MFLVQPHVTRASDGLHVVATVLRAPDTHDPATAVDFALRTLQRVEKFFFHDSVLLLQLCLVALQRELLGVKATSLRTNPGNNTQKI